MSPTRTMARDRMRRLVIGSALVSLSLSLSVALTGCVSSSSGSRAALYESLDDLARDSTAIVVGTVTGERQDDDAIIATVQIAHTPTNPQLGAEVDADGPPFVVGDVVDVRQMGDSESSSGGAPLLQAGQEYLLFLTPTMLAGDAADQYYVTGAEAGLYVRENDVFRRVVLDTGDTLPATIATTGEEELP